MSTPHDHSDGSTERCPLCPSDADVAAMRARNLADAANRRRDIGAAIAQNPTRWVFLVEASDGDGQDIVMHVATTLDHARAWCEAATTLCSRPEIRLTIMPHETDNLGRGNPLSGNVRMAIYGRQGGSAHVEDVTGTAYEYRWPEDADNSTAPGLTYPIGSLVDMAMIPTDIRTAFLDELPGILDETRDLLDNIDERARETRALLPLPSRLMPLTVVKASLMEGLTTAVTWTNDGDPVRTQTLHFKDGTSIQTVRP